MPEIMNNRVRELRVKLGLTQEALADQVEVTRQTVISIEKGEYVPSLLLAMKLARVFREPVENIFSLTKK